MNNKKDRRFIVGAEFRTKRSAAGDDALVVEARINRYGVLSNPDVPTAGCRETFAAGAFRDSLAAQDDVLATLNHDSNVPLGRVSNGKLQLRDTPEALYATIRLNPAVQAHKDIYQLCKDGTVNSCSFAFGANEDAWSHEMDERGQPYMLRTVRSAKLFDVSLLSAMPAYPQTAISARSLAYNFVSTSELESLKVIAHRQYQAIAADYRSLGIAPSSIMFRKLTLDDENRLHAAQLARDIAQDNLKG